jgi:hypothetical protein
MCARRQNTKKQVDRVSSRSYSTVTQRRYRRWRTDLECDPLLWDPSILLGISYDHGEPVDASQTFQIVILLSLLSCRPIGFVKTAKGELSRSQGKYDGIAKDDGLYRRTAHCVKSLFVRVQKALVSRS